ncbi:hypothetical protein Q7C_826 [Methylophaga frappieri]|uniref:Uncharacterized protein n=1 Tax=Methylophaga frappieri (strain ATCC BAA-2434 / DSM 25690 / JAM7) TaxID=754477 RepID=I1YGF2_METFJ|nr:hypothetical protein Q7C_826 [Methylophaga frappieri]
MVPCPAPTGPVSNHADAMVTALKQVYDQYGICAGRLFELQHYLIGIDK